MDEAKPKEEPSFEDLVKMLITEERKAREPVPEKETVGYQRERADQIKQFKKNIKKAIVWKG